MLCSGSRWGGHHAEKLTSRTEEVGDGWGGRFRVIGASSRSVEAGLIERVPVEFCADS